VKNEKLTSLRLGSHLLPLFIFYYY